MARRSRKDELEEIRLFAEHHIVALRRSRKGREIIAVKHATFGWISPMQYQVLQEIHRILPELIEAGYRIKMALWSQSISVGPVTLPAPIGMTYLSDMYFAWTTGRAHNVLKYALLAALPFGDIVYLIRWAEFIARGRTDDLQGSLFLDNILDPILVPIAKALGWPTENSPSWFG